MLSHALRRAARLVPALASLLALAVLLAACGDPHEEADGAGLAGQGDVATELRELEPFSRISVAGPFKLIVGEAAEPSVSVSAQPNLLEVIETEVRDGQLMVSLREPVDEAASEPMSITLKVPLVESVAVSNGTVAFVEHTGDALQLDVSGSSELTAIGDTSTLALNATTGAHVKLGELVAQVAQVQLNDGSTAEVNATSSITGVADGGSTLILAQKPPTVDVETRSGATIQGL